MSTFKEAVEVLEAVGAVGNARKPKDKLLKENASNTVLQDIFYRTYNWQETYGITAPKKFISSGTNKEVSWIDFLGVLTQFRTRSLTGNAARAKISELLEDTPEWQGKWFQRIINRDLQIRASDGSANRAWPGLIPHFDLPLALETNLDNVKYPVAVEPKLDGMRMLFFIGPTGKGVAVSRGAKTYDNLQFIVKQLFEAFGEGIYDGEMLAKNWNETVSLVRTSSKKMTPERIKKIHAELFFNVFERLPYHKDMPKEMNVTYKIRRGCLENLFPPHISKQPPANVRLVPMKVVNNLGELETYYQDQLEAGYEGIMIKLLDAPFEATRSNNMQKLKPFESREATILSVLEGDKPSTIGKMGRVKVRFEDGTETHVGTGFDFPTREEFWKRRIELIGMLMEVKVQEDANAVAVARFPVFVRLREDR